MSDTTQEQLLRLFAEAARNQGSADDLGAEAYSITGAAGGSGGSTDTAPKGDPNPIVPYTTPTGNTGITAEAVAKTVMESEGGLPPMIIGIIGLLEGGQAATNVLTKYAMPDSIQFEGDISSEATGTDGFDQSGMPRAGAATQTNALLGTMAPTNVATPSASQLDAPPQTKPAQNTPQPGDPQWFMDHSSDIAQAVRSAMLNLSSLNDVVSDL